MKHYIFLLLTFFTHHDIWAQYAIEDELYACYQREFSNRQIDLQSEVSEFEEVLVEAQILSDNSGESYLNYFKKVAITGSYPEFEVPDQYFDIFPLNALQASQVRCIYAARMGDSTSFYSSTFLALQDSLKARVFTNHNMVQTIAQTHVDVLSVEDFEHPYYRLRTLLIILATSEVDGGLRLPPPSERNEKPVHFREDQIATVHIDSINEIYLNGQAIVRTQLEHKLKNFIAAKGSQHVIRLEADRNTSYNTYVEVTELIQHAYTSVREDISNEKFQKPLNECTKDELEIIRLECPINLREIEPELKD